MHKRIAGGALAALSLTLLAACGGSSDTNADASSASVATVATVASSAASESSAPAASSATTESTTDSQASGEATTVVAAAGVGPGAGAPGGVDLAGVTTEAQLIELIQEAYGDGSLDLHRGHRPVEGVLNAVLTISHEELHVRMENGQNLAAVAEDLGIDPETLIDALVESWRAPIDDLAAAGTITEDAAVQYLAALREAFTFRVTWNGEDATPTFSGLS